MKTYTVRFWYYTDLRHHWTGAAFDERMALNLALAENAWTSWATGPAFRVQIIMGDGRD